MQTGTAIDAWDKRWATDAGRADWLDPHPAVGALLLYPNGAIQHAGIVLGINGYAGHPRRGSFDGGFWPWTTVTTRLPASESASSERRSSVEYEFEQRSLS